MSKRGVVSAICVLLVFALQHGGESGRCLPFPNEHTDNAHLNSGVLSGGCNDLVREPAIRGQPEVIIEDAPDQWQEDAADMPAAVGAEYPLWCYDVPSSRRPTLQLPVRRKDVRPEP